MESKRKGILVKENSTLLQSKVPTRRKLFIQKPCKRKGTDMVPTAYPIDTQQLTTHPSAETKNPGKENKELMQPKNMPTVKSPLNEITLPLINDNPINKNISILGPHPSQKLLNSNSQVIICHQQPVIMSLTDEEFIAQFAALSSEDGNSSNTIELPIHTVRSRDWGNCILMRVISQRVVTETLFSDQLRMVPREMRIDSRGDAKIEAVGGNYFLVEFMEVGDRDKALQKSIWTMRGCMVITRPAKGAIDLTEPQIETMECWVEMHGIPPGSLEDEGITLLARNIGVPVSGLKTFFHGGQKAYRLRVVVKLTEAMKDKLKLNHQQLGIVWVPVVYENVKGVCMFCGLIGHENVQCPTRQRALRMKNDENHKDTMGNMHIPETRLGKWITNRGYIPRGIWLAKPGDTPNQKETEHSKDQAVNRPVRANASTSTEGIGGKGLKRNVVSTTSQSALIVMGDTQLGVEPESQHRHLNFKRARETIPNSSPRGI